MFSFEIGQLVPENWVKCPSENTKHGQNTPSNDIFSRNTGPNTKNRHRGSCFIEFIKRVGKKR